MGTGTIEADRLAEQQNEGPFLVLFDIGDGEFMSPTLAETLEDVQAHVEKAEKASDGNVTVRSIKLSKVLAVNELMEALKEYGSHTAKCPCRFSVSTKTVCTCGYGAALHVAGEKV